MCGIFGIYFFDSSKRVNKQMLIDATNTMVHRGPDGCGFFLDDNIGLGHRRLSIIDLGTGHQPMFNEDGQIVVVYNGEIYNYKEIREQLLKKGHIFKTKCDTEVIVHAYEEWGVSCVDHFRGMFAFAIWDKNRKILFLARDRIGIKPLYFFVNDRVFLFASEIKAIFKTGFLDGVVNSSVLDAYFTLGYVPGPECLFKNVYKLLPGHFLTVREKQKSIIKYWDFPHGDITPRPFKQCQEELLHLLSECVRMRLMSHVPLGVFLSGGLDSSAIVALMYQMVTDPIKTFSIGYKNADDMNELEFAGIIAEKFQTEYYTFILEPDNFLESIRTLLHHMEEPVVESPAIALYHIAKMCKPHATVVLSGEGGDEGFGGYNLYSLMSRIENIKRKIPGISNLLSCLKPAKLFKEEKLRKYVDWLFSPLEKAYRGTSADLAESFKTSFYTEEFLGKKGNYVDTTFHDHFKQAEGKDALSKLLYVDAKTWLADDLLLKADKMSMAASVELRVPFLDHVLMEFAASLPSDFKINKEQGKYILKKSMEDLLPHEIIYRKKMGFPIPVSQWFGKELNDQARDILLSKRSVQRGYIKPTYIKKILDQQKENKGDHGRRIFSLLNLEMWHRMYIDK
jgi:asparagine synthase (glutamine-hydrolysing)